ncbi:MAG: hypothetical protein OEQ28_04410 [Acidobacteriota bacterium]|nr:hypothetical protein [Acidobacteriota bacterium]
MPAMDVGQTKGVSEIAYDGVEDERYRFPDNSVWGIREHRANRFSGFKGIIAAPEDNDELVVLAFAGTDSPLDAVVDLAQATGGLPPQYNEALRWARAVFSTEGSKLVLAGHSLGGGLAAYCSVRIGCPACTINPAPLVGALTFGALGANAQITNYIANAEFVSRSPGRNPGTDVVVASNGGMFSFFTDHSLSAVAPGVALPQRL